MSVEVHTNQVFAAIDRDLSLERYAGGNETEVYRTDDRRQVVKLKSDLGSDVCGALRHAHALAAAADRFVACLGPRYTIRSDYLLARDDAGHVQVLVVQPFISNARPLHAVDFSKLNAEERGLIARQLYDIVRRARRFYRASGTMPDIYGRSNSSSAERRRMRSPHMIPLRIWSFLVRRHLLRSHNLLLTDGPEHRVLLVDYDPVRRGKLYRTIYYMVRQTLFLRDYLVIELMRRGLLRNTRRPRAEESTSGR